jgi:hypothetical protein
MPNKPRMRIGKRFQPAPRSYTRMSGEATLIAPR